MRPTVTYSIALGIFLLDFVTKRIVLANEESFRRGIELIEGLLRFTYVRNAGAAFGIFQGGRWPFVVVSALAVVGLCWVLLRPEGRTRLRSVAYSLILGGAAGNLIDRLFYDGKVVDFIEMGWRGHIFPVYNVADMGVSIGAALLVIALLREGDKPVEDEEAPSVDHEQSAASELADSSPPEPDADGAQDESRPPEL